MKLVHLRALLGLLLGSAAIGASALSYFYKEHAVLILAVQAATIATIYSVGSNYVEHKIREEHAIITDEVNAIVAGLNRNLYKAKMCIRTLEERLGNRR